MRTSSAAILAQDLKLRQLVEQTRRTQTPWAAMAEKKVFRNLLAATDVNEEDFSRVAKAEASSEVKKQMRFWRVLSMSRSRS